MPTAKNGAIELYYETFGIQEDPVVICLPGMGNQLIIYPEEFCLALVDRGFFVIRMDNRDAGLSSITDESDEYVLSDMADDTIAVLDAVGVDTAVVLGLSLGGMVAQQLAVDHPERVRALVSLASTPGEQDLPSATPEVIAALTAPSEATTLSFKCSEAEAAATSATSSFMGMSSICTQLMARIRCPTRNLVWIKGLSSWIRVITGLSLASPSPHFCCLVLWASTENFLWVFLCLDLSLDFSFFLLDVGGTGCSLISVRRLVSLVSEISSCVGSNVLCGCDGDASP